jgi:hypothetical protein
VIASSSDGTGFGVDRTFTATSAPRLGAPKLSPASFRAAGKHVHGTTGTTVAYSDTRPSRTTFTVLRAEAGVQRNGRCVTPPRHGGAKPGRACTRYVAVGSFTHLDLAGRNHFHFSGQVARRRLNPGAYRLQATPRVSRVNGKTGSAAFSIKG